MKSIYKNSWKVFLWSILHAPTFFAVEYSKSNISYSNELKVDQSIEAKTAAQIHIEDIIIQAIHTIKKDFSDTKTQKTKLELIHTISEYLNLTTEELSKLNNIIDITIENPSKESFRVWIKTFSQTIINFIDSIFKEKLLTEYDYKIITLNQLTKEQLKNKDILTIVDQLTKLSERSRPKDIQSALQKMHQGHIVRKAIKAGKFNSIIPSSLNHREYSLFHDLLTHKKAPEDVTKELTPQSLIKIRDIYLANIVNLQWYFYKKILLQKEGFFSGSITVYDCDEKIMNFSEDYVKFINKNYNTSGLSIRSIINNDGYNRSDATTHWWGESSSLPRYKH